MTQKKQEEAGKTDNKVQFQAVDHNANMARLNADFGSVCRQEILIEQTLANTRARKAKLLSKINEYEAMMFESQKNQTNGGTAGNGAGGE